MKGKLDLNDSIDLTVAVHENQKDWPLFAFERELRNAASANRLTCLNE